MESKELRTVGYTDKEHFLVLGSVTESVYCCRSPDTFWVLVVFVAVFACVLMLQRLVVFLVPLWGFS